MMEKSKTTINLSYTSITSMDKGSSVSLSRICSLNKNVANKRNEGFGEEGGDGVIFINGTQKVDDRDFTDAEAEKFNQ
jgi:hypothetical protein